MDIFGTNILGNLTRTALAVLVGMSCITQGCKKEETPSSQEDNSSYIDFASYAPKTKAGAGSDITDTSAKLQKGAFGVFGYKSADDATNFTSVFISSPQEVGWDSGNSNWTYTPKRKWDMNMKYRFRAYWPYSSNIKANSNANILAVEYSSSVEQNDLLVAYATRDPMASDGGTGRVPLQFHHALAGLKFEIKYKEGVTSPGLEDYVTEFCLKGLNTVGTMFYGLSTDIPYSGTDKISWVLSDNTFDSTSTLFYWKGSSRFFSGTENAETGKVEGVVAAPIFDNDKVVFVIPQTLSMSESRKTTAHFRTEEGGDAVNIATIPQTKLESGKIYTFTIVIHSSYISVDVTIKDWEVLQSNVDINL